LEPPALGICRFKWEVIVKKEEQKERQEEIQAKRTIVGNKKEGKTEKIKNE
jgi:hypothetical protein